VTERLRIAETRLAAAEQQAQVKTQLLEESIDREEMYHKQAQTLRAALERILRARALGDKDDIARAALNPQSAGVSEQLAEAVGDTDREIEHAYRNYLGTHDPWPIKRAEPDAIYALWEAAWRHQPFAQSVGASDG
jgi:hypothetical protein